MKSNATITIRGGFTSVGRLACVFLAGISSVAATAATDGTWASATAGGNWSDAANWVGGVLPSDGGVARFALTGWPFDHQHYQRPRQQD